MSYSPRVQPFRWDVPTGAVAVAAALCCLVPTIGFLLAWHMAVDLGAFTLFATVPALVGLAVCEAILVRKSPLLFNRLASGLAGGLAGVLAFDLVRVPGEYAFKGAPDYVPLIGQHLLGDPIGIAPTGLAIAVGYAYHYILMGALLGAAYSLVLGRGRWYWASALGLLAAVAFLALPQAQLLTLARGFSPGLAGVVWAMAFFVGATVLGLVVHALGRTMVNALYVVFMREELVETPPRATADWR